MNFSGLVNSGYRVRGKNEDQKWTEIGRRSPKLPQMFYPIRSNITIEQGDYVAALCTMLNTRSHTVRIGYSSFLLVIYINSIFLFVVQLVMMKCVIFILCIGLMEISY
jgi:hypothetical protein